MTDKHDAATMHYDVMTILLRHIAQAADREKRCLTPIGKFEARAQVQALRELLREIEGLH